MQEQFNELLDQLRGIWFKRRYILVSAWLLCPIGWFGVSLIPDIYESTARVYVDTDSVLSPLLEGITVEYDSDKKIDLMVKTLLSRTNLERIARMTDLDISTTNDTEYEIMIQDLSDDFFIKKERRDNIYTLAIQNQDPLLAKKIVEAALSVFIDNTLVDNREESNEALRFLDSQIVDYEQKLKKSERLISAYKKEYSNVLPDYAKGFYAYLNDETTRLSDTRLEYAVVETELQKARESLYNRGESTTFSSAYEIRIIEMQQSLDALLLKYTEEHPSVKEIIARVEHLKNLKKTERKKYQNLSLDDKKAQFDLDSNNPFVHELQLKIADLESRLFVLKVKRDSFETRIATLKGRIDLVPAVEAHLTELRRNYEINKSQYEELRSRRESAQISNSMEEETNNISFKIIEPPRVPVKPKGPKRMLFLLGVTLVGFGTGIVLSFLHSQIAPSVLTKSQISQHLNIPVYGESYATIASGIPAQEKRKKWIFIISNIVLLSCLSLLVGWYMKDAILLILNKVAI